MLGALHRKFPHLSEASLLRAFNYNEHNVEQTSQYIFDAAGDDSCTGAPTSCTPADGWRAGKGTWALLTGPNGAADTRVRKPAPVIEAQPSRQMQAATEQEFMAELEQFMDKAVRAAENEKHAKQMAKPGGTRPSSASGNTAAAAPPGRSAHGAAASSAAAAHPKARTSTGGRPSSADSLRVRPWQVARQARPRLEAQHWNDTGTPCLLCRQRSTPSAPMLTSEYGMCKACQAYYAALGADDRPDLTAIRFDLGVAVGGGGSFPVSFSPPYPGNEEKKKEI